MFVKGDIVMVPFPFTNNRSVKKRPAVVISGETINKTGDIVLVQITSKENNDGLSLEITPNDVTEPLPKRSFIRVHKIFVLEEKLIMGQISHLKPNKYNDLIKHILKVIE